MLLAWRLGRPGKLSRDSRMWGIVWLPLVVPAVHDATRYTRYMVPSYATWTMRCSRATCLTDLVATCLAGAAEASV